MNRTFGKLFFVFMIALCFSVNAYSEDWLPNIFDDTKFEKANDTVKEYVVKNGIYLSGTKDFSFYYLNDVNISPSAIKAEENHKFVFVILYKGKTYFYKSFNAYRPGIMDYSIISCTPPIIYLKFNSGIGLDTVIISYDGTDFVMNSIDCIYASFENQGRYGELMSIPSKYYYLQGRKIFKNDFAGQTYVYSDEKNKIYEPDSHYRLWLLGIDDAKSVSEVYYQTYITDDNIPLRTSNSKDAKVTALLEKGTEVRVLSVDPSLNKMEGKNGFWVLVETETERIGWLWSACLKDFSHETTRHFRDFDPIKTW